VRKLCIALNKFAEASAISEMRLAICSRPQDSQALSENPITTQNDVARITDFKSADTVKRFSMDAPKNPGGHFAEEWLIFREGRRRKTTEVLKPLDFFE
jgi:hypothetical protein